MANVVIGTGAEIHAFLFGAAPSAKAQAEKKLKQAWNSRRKVQAINKAFGLKGNMEVNNRAVRNAIKALREAGA